MCGIAGWFSSQPIRPEDDCTLESMTASLAHRGPDGQGRRLFSLAALGHTRLAIIDIDDGAQPMCLEGSQVCISYNGEIYNYQLLRDELAGKGCQFRTASDTEVILHLYATQGTTGFSRLRGMFAFALWDEGQKTGYLVRDPQGIKPLFFQAGANNTLIFASEAKAILAKTRASGQLDEEALHLLMNFRYLPGAHSLFRGIEQLPPAGLLRWTQDGRYSQHSIGAPAANTELTLEAALEESVRSHLVADVEVGAYLSGGIDSALITRFARAGADNFRTFTLDVGDDPQEAANARKSAELLQVNNLQSAITADSVNDLPKLIWHLETPKINALQVYQLARFAGQHVKVALSGLGGDELFYGYNAHALFYQLDRLQRYSIGPLRRLAGAALGALTHLPGTPAWSEPYRFGQMLKSMPDWPRVYGLLRNLWDTPEMRRRVYGPRMLDCKLPNAFGHVESNWPQESDPVRAMAQFEWQGKMVNDLLWQEDRCAMAVGLEVRTPFVDSLLKDYVAKIPRSTLMPHGTKKGLLIDSAKKLLPPTILQRPKSGFQVDSPQFFHSQLMPLAKIYLREENILKHGLFNPAFVRDTLKMPQKKTFRWHYFMLYLMLTTHIWLDVFEDRQ